MSVEGKSARDCFSAAFYSDAIQNTLHSHHKAFFESLWERVLAQQATLGLRVAQVRSLVSVLFQMRGREFDADLSVCETLQTIFPQYIDVDEKLIDPSVMMTDMHRDDFYYYLLRMVACDFWALNRKSFAAKRRPPAAAPAEEDAAQCEEATAEGDQGEVVVEEVDPEAALSLEERVVHRLLQWIEGPPPVAEGVLDVAQQ